MRAEIVALNIGGRVYETTKDQLNETVGFLNTGFSRCFFSRLLRLALCCFLLLSVVLCDVVFLGFRAVNYSDSVLLRSVVFS